MTYTKAHDPWADSPSTTTPVTAASLDTIEAGIAAAVISPNTTITGVAWYATTGLLPATGVAGVLYVVDAG